MRSTRRLCIMRTSYGQDRGRRRTRVILIRIHSPRRSWSVPRSTSMRRSSCSHGTASNVIDGGLSRAHAGALTRTTRRLTISDRLARFRQRRKAWKALSWTRCVTVPMPGSCCAYEVARRSRRRGGGWAWTFGGAFNVVRVAPRTRSASAHTHPPLSRRTSARLTRGTSMTAVTPRTLSITPTRIKRETRTRTQIPRWA